MQLSVCNIYNALQNISLENAIGRFFRGPRSAQILSSSAVREVTQRNKIIIECQWHRRNFRNHPGRCYPFRDEETEVRAGKATWQSPPIVIAGCQSLIWSRVHRPGWQVHLLGTQITFSWSGDFCFSAKAIKSEEMPISHFRLQPGAKWQGWGQSIGIHLKV